MRIVVIGCVDGQIEAGLEFGVRARRSNCGAFRGHMSCAGTSSRALRRCQIAPFPRPSSQRFCYALLGRMGRWVARRSVPGSSALGERIADTGAGWLYPMAAGPSSRGGWSGREVPGRYITRGAWQGPEPAVSSCDLRRAMDMWRASMPCTPCCPRSRGRIAGAGRRCTHCRMVHLVDGAVSRDEIRRMARRYRVLSLRTSENQLTAELDGLAAEVTVRGSGRRSRPRLQALRKEAHFRDLQAIADLREQIGRRIAKTTAVRSEELNQDVSNTLPAAAHPLRAIALARRCLSRFRPAGHCVGLTTTTNRAGQLRGAIDKYSWWCPG